MGFKGLCRIGQLLSASACIAADAAGSVLAAEERKAFVTLTAFATGQLASAAVNTLTAIFQQRLARKPGEGPRASRE